METVASTRVLRHLDHIAIAVEDTETALEYFTSRLGLQIVHTEELDSPPVSLTYLDAGNVLIQLVSPLRANSDLGRWLERHGSGFHHICFAVDDVEATATALSDAGLPAPVLGQGRGRLSAFLATTALGGGVLIECTEIDPRDGAGDGRST